MRELREIGWLVVRIIDTKRSVWGSVLHWRVRLFQSMSGLYFSRKGMPKITSFHESSVTRVRISHRSPSISVSMFDRVLTVALGLVDPSAYRMVMGSPGSGSCDIQLLIRKLRSMKFSWAPESTRAVACRGLPNASLIEIGR